jgi:putative chitinase
MLKTPRLFFDSVHSVLGTLEQSEVDGCNAILAAMEGSPLSWTAYALGTAFLETAGSMEPVIEANWLSKPARERYYFKMYDIAGARPEKAKELGNLCAGDGIKFCGMGYPQMTGRKNYTKADAKLRQMGLLKAGESLVDNPELAMRPDIAAAVMRYGMTEGWFTGKGFADYLPRKGPATLAQFVPARRIINGQDRARDVAGFAVKFQTGLEAGGWA